MYVKPSSSGALYSSTVSCFLKFRLKSKVNGSTVINQFREFIFLNYLLYQQFCFMSKFQKMTENWDCVYHTVCLSCLIFLMLYFDSQQLCELLSPKTKIFYSCIKKTCLLIVYPLKHHFHIAKLGYARVYLFFLFLLQNIDCGYSLEPPQRGGSYVYPQSMF